MIFTPSGAWLAGTITMTGNNKPTAQGISRRDVLTGVAAASLATALPVGASARVATPAASIKQWDMTTDVLVAGSGATGISALPLSNFFHTSKHLFTIKGVTHFKIFECNKIK